MYLVVIFFHYCSVKLLPLENAEVRAAVVGSIEAYRMTTIYSVMPYDAVQKLYKHKKLKDIYLGTHQATN
jgi:hypothetical protein